MSMMYLTTYDPDTGVWGHVDLDDAPGCHLVTRVYGPFLLGIIEDDPDRDERESDRYVSEDDMSHSDADEWHADMLRFSDSMSAAERLQFTDHVNCESCGAGVAVEHKNGTTFIGGDFIDWEYDGGDMIYILPPHHTNTGDDCMEGWAY